MILIKIYHVICGFYKIFCSEFERFFLLSRLFFNFPFKKKPAPEINEHLWRKQIIIYFSVANNLLSFSYDIWTVNIRIIINR